MHIQELDQLGGDSYAVPVDPDKVRALKVFVSLPKEYLKADTSSFRFIAEDKQSNERDTYSAQFFEPDGKK